MPPQTQRETVEIHINGKVYQIDAPAGLPDAKVLSLAAGRDPEFAKDYAIRQQQNVTKTLGERMRPSYTAQAVDAPKQGLESGLSSPAVDPNTAEKMRTGAAIGSVGSGIVTGGVRAVPGIARTLAGAAGGAALGGYGGREIGGIFGPGAAKVGGQIGATLGGLGGGIAGGFRGRSAPSFVERDATRLNTPFAGEEMPSAPFERDATKLNEPYAGEAPPEGWNAKLSDRIKPPVRTSPFGPTSTSTSSPALAPGGSLPQPATAQQAFPLRVAERAGKVAKASPSAPAGVSGSVAKANDRLVLLPEEAQAEAQMRGLAQQRAQERGMYYAGEMRPPGTTGPGAKPVNRVPRQSTPTTTPFQPPLASRVAGETAPLRTETDSLGIRWAVHPETGYRVSIPKSVPDEGIEAYARQKLAEQQQIHQQLTGGQQ